MGYLAAIWGVDPEVTGVSTVLEHQSDLIASASLESEGILVPNREYLSIDGLPKCGD